MKRSGLLFVGALASVAGSVVDSSEPAKVALGERFQLKVAQSARIEAEALHVGFEGVSTDSRCPQGEQCIREGDATVLVWLQKADGAKETHELHTSPKEKAAASAQGYSVRLLRLDPNRVSGKTIGQGDYLATLEVTHAASAPRRSDGPTGRLVARSIP